MEATRAVSSDGSRTKNHQKRDVNGPTFSFPIYLRVPRATSVPSPEVAFASALITRFMDRTHPPSPPQKLCGPKELFQQLCRCKTRALTHKRPWSIGMSKCNLR